MPAIHRIVAAAVYDERSLTIPVSFTWDDWAREVKDIQWRHRAILWWLGDAMIFGSERFSETYAQAVEDYSEDSITRAMAVCREFPPQRRRAIGFSFHAAVMAKGRGSNKRLFTPEQADALLDLAVAQKMTREAFREMIKERRAAIETIDSLPLPIPEDDLVDAGALDQLEPIDEGPPIIKVAELINLFPNQEPAPPLSPDEAASRLMMATRSNQLPEDIAEAILIVLADRDRLIEEARLQSARSWS